MSYAAETFHTRHRQCLLATLPPATSLGARVKRLRLAKNLSQQALANMAGIYVKTLTHLETHPERGVQSRHLVGLCRALGVSADYLLGLTDHP